MTKLFNRLNIALVLALLVATLFGFAMMPAGSKLPAHWNIYGVVDRFGPRNQVLIVLPLFAAVAAALLAGIELIIERIGRADVGRQFALVLSVVLTLFAAVQASTVLIGMGYSIDVPRIVAIVQGLGLIVTGNMLPKSSSRSLSIPSNDARHRYRVLKVTGILMMLAGGVLFVAVLAGVSSKQLFALNIGGVVVVTTSGLLCAYLAPKFNKT
jgi:uncharacterized membrane protein